MAEKIEKKIFKNGSTTYYWSTAFFPKAYRDDVFALYSFVRTADDYVDVQPVQKEKLLALEKNYLKAIQDPTYEVITHGWDDIDTRVIKNIVRLCHKYKFEESWVRAFFASMKQDIDSQEYKTLEDSLGYVYGSAEVIGLMMARIIGSDNPKNVRRVLNIGKEQAQNDPDMIKKQTLLVQDFARMQGRAMQWINFIRDIEEDNRLGRLYFPTDDLKKYGLKDLSLETANTQKTDFERFMRLQIKRYRSWQEEADKGIDYIPVRLRSGIKTAVEMYNWTAKQIEANPLIVYDKKIKPSKLRVLAHGTNRVVKKAGKLLTKQENVVSKK